jgi:NAD+ synthase
MQFNKNILQLACAKEVDKIGAFIKKQVVDMKREGVVIGLSGGIDSAVCSALCAKILGKEKVLGVILPEKESNPISEKYAAKHAQEIGIKTETRDITPILTGMGTYERRDQAIREVFPEFDNQLKSKIVLPQDILTTGSFNYFTLKITDDQGKEQNARLNNQILRRIVAATNSKQITRMMCLNYYADLNNLLVCGTTNRSEYMQGFFVKFGDGGVDFEPIEHLYKIQVYQLANYLNIIPEIIERAPSPDTFSFCVTDQEMYFRMPFNQLDPLLYAWENQIPIPEAAKALDLEEDQVKRVFRDLTSKFNTTRNLRMPPQSLINSQQREACLSK